MKKQRASTIHPGTEVRIIEALKGPKYKYRTASGIARETQIDKIKVVKILQSNPSVRVSLTKAKDGSRLYALKSKVSAASDVWTAFKAINGAKFGD
jgi:hypothetical protein